jgi:hypothetical protein
VENAAAANFLNWQYSCLFIREFAQRWCQYLQIGGLSFEEEFVVEDLFPKFST